MSASVYPVHVDAHVDSDLSRWLWLVKWLLVIPHLVILAFLWVAFTVLSVIAFFAILFTGRYPRAIFDFNVGVLRWTWRVSYYAWAALGTDRYPPFSLEERADYPTHLEIDYPDRLSRGLVLVKWWLLAIPHYLVVGLFLGGTGWAISDVAQADSGNAGRAGLISLLVLVAAVVLLFSGRYPTSIFDLVLGLNRWVLRVAAYAALMTDVYPPFRLDQGGEDPTVLRAGELPVAPGAPATRAPWPADPAVPRASGTPAPGTHAPGTQAPNPTGTRSHGWSTGRIVALVVGCVVLLGSAAVGLAGAGLAVADRGLRDDDGYLMSGTTHVRSDTYAITSTSLSMHADAPPALMPDRLLGDVKVRVQAGTHARFVGIARTADVSAYLGQVEHATVTDYRDGPVYETTGTTAPAEPPTARDIWVAQSTGTGTLEVVWPARNGDWTLVVMNADGTRDVRAGVAAGATVPALDWLVPTLLAAAAVGLAVALVLIVVSVGSSTREADGAAS